MRARISEETDASLFTVGSTLKCRGSQRLRKAGRCTSPQKYGVVFQKLFKLNPDGLVSLRSHTTLVNFDIMIR